MNKSAFLVRSSVVIFILLMGSTSLFGQNWSEQLPFSYTYDLSKVRILTVAADEFNYEETVEMGKLWTRFGAQVEYAGPQKTLTGEEPEFRSPDGKKIEKPILTVDLLLSAVDVSRYDIIYFAGGEGIAKLLQEHKVELQRLIADAVRNGKSVAAMCHAPLALSASEHVKGKKVTANGRGERQALIAAGAIVTDDVCVRDGFFLTGQWPFLGTFALAVAENHQFPGGGGPLEKFLANRTPLQKMLDDIRSTPMLASNAIGPDTLEIVLRSALKTPPLEMTMMPRSPFRIIALTSKESKSFVAAKVFEQSKNYFISRGAPEQAIKQLINNYFAKPPVLYVAVTDPSLVDTVGHRSMEAAMQNGIVTYGAARENMVLSARAMGLGISLLGFPRFLAADQEIKNVLGIPSSAKVLDMFALGYPEMQSLPPVSRPVSDVVFMERWGVTK